VLRAKILLAAHEHPRQSNAAIARRLGCSVLTVRKWRQRWDRTHSVCDATRSGCPRLFSLGAARATDRASLPRDSGQPLSRWSAAELARHAPQQGIVKTISPSTVKRWLRAERINPWQYRSWQQSSDPRFLEKAVPILRLYEQAQALALAGHLVRCADEKTSIQARQLEGGVRPTRRGQPMQVGDRYHRRGALQLFAGLPVARGQTMARCFATKQFANFQCFLQRVFASAWSQKLVCLHLI